MVKILVVIPYKSVQEQMIYNISQIQNEGIEISTTHVWGTDDSVIAKNDPDIVVARGMTYAAWKKKMPHKHIIEISMTSFDILNALAQAKQNFKPNKAALCLPNASKIDLQGILGFIDFDIVTYDIHNEVELLDCVNSGLSDGVDTFVGGLTLSQICEERDIPYIHIKTGDAALEEAVAEAMNTAHAIQQERAKAVIFQSVLNNAPDAIVTVDMDGKISAANAQSRTVFRVPPDEIMLSKQIETYIKGVEWAKTVKENAGHDALLGEAGSLLYVRCRPLRAGNGTVGAMITVQPASKIQDTETKIRKELSAKGLTAKYSFNDIVGTSHSLRKTISVATKYARVDANVLIVGETGTGKELFAQSIHSASSRRNEPFVAVNCAALPENLLESELFGYVEGAFSGAVKGGKIGLFELAHNGTIFLDEIGEMPLSLQAKLLRVLQEKEIRRLGGDRVQPVNVRVISATNIDLQKQTEDKTFRADLFYRLNLLSLSLPPLRERPEDISVMTDYFLRLFVQMYDKVMPVLSEESRAVMAAYSWPGNSRELRNFCERFVVLDEIGHIDKEQLLSLGIPDNTVDAEDDTLFNLPATKDELALLMRDRKLTNTELAEQLGISRTTLWRWSKKL